VIGAKDTEIAVWQARHEGLDRRYQAQLAELGGQAGALRGEVAELRARPGMTPRSSSKPSSSEGMGKPSPKSLRGKSGRRPGRPEGQPGATPEMTSAPDQVIRHEPSRCRSCGAGLAGAAEAGTGRRQVFDLPVRSAAIRCAVSSMLGSVLPAGPSVSKLAFTKLRSPVLSR
jgi:transposase